MGKKIDITEFAKKGADAFQKKYGKDKYSEMGKKGAKVRKEKDPEFGKKLSALGVAARKKKKEKENASSVDKVAAVLTGN